MSSKNQRKSINVSETRYTALRRNIVRVLNHFAIGILRNPDKNLPFHPCCCGPSQKEEDDQDQVHKPRPPMRLILSSRKPVHAAYKDAATGVVHYKVRSSNKLHEFVSTITRRIDVDIPRRNSGHPQAGTESDRGQAGTIGDRFGLLAQLCWYLRSPSVIRFGGEEIDPATFFRKVEMPWYVKLPVRVFTGKDGKEYKWSCSMHHTTQLRLNDGSDTLVAEYHPRSLGLISKKRDPCLEIFPPFEHMVDEILITFIYIERLRRVKRSRRDGTQ